MEGVIDMSNNDYFVLKKEGKYYYEPYLDYDNEYKNITQEE